MDSNHYKLFIERLFNNFENPVFANIILKDILIENNDKNSINLLIDSLIKKLSTLNEL